MQSSYDRRKKGAFERLQTASGPGGNEGQEVISETGEGGECAGQRIAVWVQSLEQEVIEAIRRI